MVEFWYVMQRLQKMNNKTTTRKTKEKCNSTLEVFSNSLVRVQLNLDTGELNTADRCL